MKNNESYKWDPEEGSALYKIEMDNNVFYGSARCHPDDESIKSEKIGLEIAEIRARLNILRYLRDSEYKPQLKILKHLQSNMMTSKKYNKKSYEARMLWRQINILENDLRSIKEMIKSCNKYIADTIASAESYQKYKNGRD